MPQLIDTIKLRNKREVYELADGYRVDHVDAHGTKHQRRIPDQVANFCAEEFSGRELTVEEAKKLLQPHAQHLDLPYTYGYKLKFYAQKVLIVLVASGRVTMRKKGNRYLYAVQ
jgi:hypothetical protein